jgi:hypothetical protein
MKWQQLVWNRPVLGQPVAEVDSSLLSLGRLASGEARVWRCCQYDVDWL